MIKLNQEIVTAKEQNISFDKLSIVRDANGNLYVDILFSVTNESGVEVATKRLAYGGVDFNDFWSGFTSGKYLYEKLVEKEKLPVTVDASVEDSFVNTVPEVVEVTE